MRVCVGSPGTFSTRKWRVRDARDLREVRDRQHLRALGEALQRRRRPRAPSRRRCPRRSRRRRASRRRPPRRARARSARARRPTRCPRSARTAGRRSAGSGTSPRRRRSARPRARAARRGTRPPPSRATRARRRRPRRRRFAFASRSPRGALSTRAAFAPRPRDGPPRRLDRIAALGRRPELALGRGRQLEQLLVRRRREAAPEVGDRLQPLLDALERARLGVERGDEAVEVAPDLAQRTDRSRSSSALAPSSGAMRSSGASARSARGERRGALALVRRDRRGRGARRLGQLLDVPEPLASREQLLLVAGLHALGRVDERLQLGQPERDGVGIPRQLVERRRRRQLAPRELRLASALELLAPQNASRTSSWNDRRARRRCSNWPDIAMSRSAAAATSSRATARPTRTRACARRRTRAARRRARPRLRAGARRAPRAPRRRRSRRARRARPRRTPRSLRSRPTTRPRARRAEARSPARRSSSPRPSRP